MTSSSASFRNIRGNTRNGEYLLYHNCVCKWSPRQRATVRISKSKDNPNKLYYCCQYAMSLGHPIWCLTAPKNIY